MRVSPPLGSVWTATNPSDAGYTSTRSRATPIHSSKTRRYGAKDTPPWMSTRRFGQHSRRSRTGRPASCLARPTRSNRMRSHEGIPPALAVRREGLGRHGDVLFARRRSRGLHPVARSARPRHVGLAVDRALPERAEVEVLAQRDLALVVGHRADAVEAVRQAEV